MEIIDEVCEKGVIERRFTLTAGEELVPGMQWLPENDTAHRPAILIGHGGTQHKRVANVLGLARKLVRHGGFGVVALDAPGYGDRMTQGQRSAQAERLARRAGERLASLSEEQMQAMVSASSMVVREWKALLDDLIDDPRWAGGPFGYWGVSMGTAFGLPLLATEPRIAAAVLGLDALRGDGVRQTQQASAINIPLLFLFQ